MWSGGTGREGVTAIAGDVDGGRGRAGAEPVAEIPAADGFVGAGACDGENNMDAHPLDLFVK